MSKSKRPQTPNIRYRAFDVAVSPTSIDEDKRSVEAVLASDTPVDELDYDRWEVVPTVLLMSGCQMPKDRSIVLLDAHSRSGPVAGNIKGSARDLRAEGGNLVGRLEFAGLAADEWTLVREGHLKAVSIGRTDKKSVFVPENQTQRFDGRDFKGPVRVVTSWIPREVSLVPIGADPTALLREFQESNNREPENEPGGSGENERSAQQKKGSPKMDRFLKLALVARGMKSDLSDEQIVAALVERGMPADTAVDKVGEWVETRLDTLIFAVTKPDDTSSRGQASVVNMTPEQLAELVDRAAEARENKKREAELKLRGEIETYVKARNDKLGFDDEVVRDIASRATSLQHAGDLIIDEVGRREDPSIRTATMPRVSLGASQSEKIDAEIGTAMSLRWLEGVSDSTKKNVFPEAERAKGYDRQLDQLGLMDFARIYANRYRIASGYDSDEMIAQKLFGIRYVRGIQIRDGGAAYHMTGSFPNLMLDAANKTMLAGWGEARSTYEQVFTFGDDAKDFKNLNRVRYGAIGNLPLWSDNTKAHEGSFSDSKETYAVEAFAETVSFSFRTIINDDLTALRQVPRAMGDAARRTVNYYAWSRITSNPSIYDGQALFLETPTGNRFRSNLTTGSTVPTVTVLGGMKNKMRQMRSLNTPEGAESDAILNIEPEMLVVPSALETVSEQLINSIADPAASGNAGIHNPARSLRLVVEPLLDSSSATAFYLFANPNRAPVVEITFLRGYRTPQIKSWMDDATDSVMWRAAQIFGTAALSEKGAQKHNGA